MPVFQVVHIEAGHHMAYAERNQFRERIRKMCQPCHTGNCKDSLPSQVVNNIGFHIAFNQQDIFLYRPS